jgi:hypothetical protein
MTVAPNCEGGGSNTNKISYIWFVVTSLQNFATIIRVIYFGLYNKKMAAVRRFLVTCGLMVVINEQLPFGM